MTKPETVIRQLVIEQNDADVWAIGYPDDPIFYFGPEHMELARRLLAAYNENAANHVCKIIQWKPAEETWECVECGRHHLTR